MDGCTISGLAFIVIQATIHCPQPAVPDAARFCQTVEAPIRYSRTDTAETRAQLRSLNAKWRAVCAPETAGR
ncbi:hypothetical protein BHAOGJBA_1669 [Methylobacterium hispanicum]|uniref:Uncharacterized protein n=1 Tax=Methylobacterium hispanicum TaxID=270350 RepID=A0AAV4ZJ36_9HYPH|nr:MULTISPECIES: hypothetical protein [Methylobacterium]GJD88156.1 hypothetical protein BHAOGJBA_1669 [Methylobacterium hispanicum]